MTTAFWVSYASLWVIVVFEGVALWALFYHNGRLLVTTLSRSQSHGPELGATAPHSRRRALSGAPVVLAGLRPFPQAILFTSAHCQICELAMQTAAQVVRDQGPDAVAIVCGGSVTDVDHLARSLGLPPDVMVVDGDGSIARQWDIVSVPFAVKVGPDGRVVQRGNPSSAQRVKELLGARNAVGPAATAVPLASH